MAQKIDRSENVHLVDGRGRQACILCVVKSDCVILT